MTTLSWVSCDGGPHVFAASELAGLWGGTQPPQGGRVVNAKFRWSSEPDAPATDYDAACDVNDLVGLVPVGNGVGLVLGDEVPMSTWASSHHFAGGVIVVPMEWPEPNVPDDRLLDAVHSITWSSFLNTGIILPAPSGKSMLFAAADNGPSWFYPSVEVSMSPGRYRVLTAEAKVQGFWLRVHALDNAA